MAEIRPSSAIAYTSISGKSTTYGTIIMQGVAYRVIDDNPNTDHLQINDIVMLSINKKFGYRITKLRPNPHCKAIYKNREEGPYSLPLTDILYILERV